MAPLTRLALAACALTLGGCQTMFDAVGVAQPLSAGEQRKYDGSWQGRVHQISATAPGCPTEDAERVIMVGDGVLWYAYTPQIFFDFPIKYDGSIEATSGPARIVGHVKGNHLKATVTTPQCQTQLSMDFVYNHS